MKIELFFIIIIGFIVYNTYHDNKYTKLLYSYKKYYKIAFYICLGLTLYYLFKKNPSQGKNLLFYANNMVKFMPLSKSSVDYLSPIIDLTTTNNASFMENFNNIPQSSQNKFCIPKGRNRQGVQKRSVSETKKKYVASQQEWKCENCMKQLDHTYEIDHKIRLEYGGSNDVQNLVALCRNCHGIKTASENM